MTRGTDVVTREELRELVCSTPMIKVAERFEVSSSYLARMCTELREARQQRGYWVKLAVGKAHSLASRKVDDEVHLKPYKKLLVDITASRAGLDKALDFANDLFNALESAGHRVVIAPPDAQFWRERIDEKEVPPKKDPRHDPYGYDRRWSPYRPTVAYVDSVAFGLAVIEMTESVEMRYVNGKYIRESEYVPPKTRRYHDHTWTSTRDLPSGRLRLVVYAADRSVSWSTSFQATKARTLTQDIPRIVKSIEGEVASIIEKMKEAGLEIIWRDQGWQELAGELMPGTIGAELQELAESV